MPRPDPASLAVQHLPHRLQRDARRTIARFFWPGSAERAATLIEQLMALDDAQVDRELTACLAHFGERSEDLLGRFDDHFREACHRLDSSRETTPARRRLIGAYFTMEYAYASAAIFNPSMVPALDHAGASEGSLRFMMSVRAVGEGHISSIMMRTGSIDPAGTITFDPVPERSRRLQVVENRDFRKEVFLRKVIETGAYSLRVSAVLDALDERFTIADLTRAIEATRAERAEPDASAEAMLWLARSNYRIETPPDASLNELVIFPLSETEANGIEDMRLVLFTDDDGSQRYYGTYTAYSGSAILPQLMEITADRTAEVHTLSGRFAANKGMALFPRRIGGWYAMLTRHDGVNLHLATSDNLSFWNRAVLVQQPRRPWELVQIGNCGSPLETEAGWLVLTHGVGAMRRYCIGATLLAREDPSRRLGTLAEPLLVPDPGDRGGYVPNVVYSCGGLIHGDRLIIPYGIGDVEIGFATVSVTELLERLCP